MKRSSFLRSLIAVPAALVAASVIPPLPKPVRLPSVSHFHKNWDGHYGVSVMEQMNRHREELRKQLGYSAYKRRFENAMRAYDDLLGTPS